MAQVASASAPIGRQILAERYSAREMPTARLRAMPTVRLSPPE